MAAKILLRKSAPQVLEVETKFDASRLWIHPVSPIRPEVGEQWITYLLEEFQGGGWKNTPPQWCFNLMFQQFFQKTEKQAEKMNNRRMVMTEEAKEWAGFNNIDPGVNAIRFNKGIIKGHVHTYSTIRSYLFTVASNNAQRKYNHHLSQTKNKMDLAKKNELEMYARISIRQQFVELVRHQISIWKG